MEKKPGTFRRFFSRLNAFGRRVGLAEARLLMSGFYWLALGPAALLARKSPYVRAFAGEGAGWSPLPAQNSQESAKSQH